MKGSFSAVVLAGHKEDAVEVPPDAAALERSTPIRFAPGRTGVPVRAKVNGVSFTSHLVRRSGKRWLLLPPDVERDAAVSIGAEVRVSLEAAID